MTTKATLAALIAAILTAGASPALAAGRVPCQQLAMQTGLTPAFYSRCETVIHLCDPRYPHEMCLASLAQLDLFVVRDLAIADAAEVLPPDNGMEGSQLAFEANKRVRMIEEAAPFADLERATAKGLLQNAAAALPAVAAAPHFPATTDPEVARAWGIDAVGAPIAWARGVTGKGVRVAVIDTGIDYTHHDLKRAYIGGANFVEPARADDPMDDEGHGTHVSGTIAAAKDGADVVGVAPDASLVAVKVLDARGHGTNAHVIGGIDWAVKQRVNIISMSLGGTHSQAVCRAVAKAKASGILVIAAAGNNPRTPVGSPADCPGAVAISAMAPDGSIAKFSSRGPLVAFIAPGVDVPSDKLGGGLAVHSGTSMATPHVAGLAALAIQLLGNSSGPAVYDMLARAARPLPSLKPVEQGRGFINAGLWFQQGGLARR